MGNMIRTRVSSHGIRACLARKIEEYHQAAKGLGRTSRFVEETTGANAAAKTRGTRHQQGIFAAIEASAPLGSVNPHKRKTQKEKLILSFLDNAFP